MAITASAAKAWGSGTIEPISATLKRTHVMVVIGPERSARGLDFLFIRDPWSAFYAPFSLPIENSNQTRCIKQLSTLFHGRRISQSEGALEMCSRGTVSSRDFILTVRAEQSWEVHSSIKVFNLTR